MTGDDTPGGPLDVATLEMMARRASAQPLVDGWAFRPDSIAPRRLELSLDAAQYPEPVEAVRLDVRWFEGGDYTFHYLESRPNGRWQCRWDRHPKPDGPRTHFHPPPDASPDVDESEITVAHHLGVLFAILDWIESRLEAMYET